MDTNIQTTDIVQSLQTVIESGAKMSNVASSV